MSYFIVFHSTSVSFAWIHGCTCDNTSGFGLWRPILAIRGCTGFYSYAKRMLKHELRDDAFNSHLNCGLKEVSVIFGLVDRPGEKETYGKKLVAMCSQTANHGSKKQCAYPYPRTDGCAFAVALNVSTTVKGTLISYIRARTLMNSSLE